MKCDSTAPSVPFLRTSDRHSGYGRVKGGVGTHLPRPQSDHEASLPASLLSSCMLSKVMGVSKTWVPAYGGHKVTTRLHCRGQHPLVKHTKSFGRSASRGISQPRFNLRKKYFFWFHSGNLDLKVEKQRIKKYVPNYRFQSKVDLDNYHIPQLFKALRLTCSCTLIAHLTPIVKL